MKLHTAREVRADRQGANKNIMLTPNYMGWQPTPYGPVEITPWPGSTWMVREAKLLTFTTQRVII